MNIRENRKNMVWGADGADRAGPAQRIAQVVRSLGGEEAQVLELLYGFGSHPSHELQEVARALQLPEDAVLKVAGGALKKLRQPGSLRIMSQALDDGVSEMWEALVGPDELLFKAEWTRTLETRLPGEFQLALRVLDLGLHSWLQVHAHELAKAWYRGAYDGGTVEAAMERVSRLREEINLPLPIQRVAEHLGMEKKLLILAVKVGESAAIHKGYLTFSPYGTREVCAIELHQLFALRYGGKFVKAGQLLEDHRRHFSKDCMTLEYLEMVLYAHPHLFIQVGEEGWACVGGSGEDWSYLHCGSGPLQSLANGLGHRPSILKKRGSSRPDSLDFLREALKSGPLHASALVDRFKGSFGREVTVKLLSALVQTSHEVVLAAPEIYMLREHLEDLAMMESASERLMSLRFCRVYALGRYAGEPADAYPLWGHLGEEKLCRWAQIHASRKLFASLLAVVDPKRWNAPQSLVDLWSFKKSCIGRRFHLLRAIKPVAAARLPTLEDVLCASLAARQRGYVNWLRIQRMVDGRLMERLSDESASSILAILIGLGVAMPAEHWQKPHLPGPRMDEVVQLLMGHLGRSGVIYWEEPAGAQLLERLKELSAKEWREESLGWVHRDYFRALIQALSEPGSRKKPGGGRKLSRSCPHKETSEDLGPDFCREPLQLRMPFSK